MTAGSLAVGGEPTFVTPIPGFQDLYQRHADAVYRTALRVTGNAADAEDVLQNVFVRLLDRKLAVDPNWSPEGYLRRAATNASIDLLRRKAASHETAMEDGRDFPGKEGTVFLKQRMRRALAKLEPAEAELFVLCYLEGYSYEELAKLFGVERGTIASRLFRTRAVLRKDLSK
jgi:RNA polymerase sigma-70 factor (ECF subfamily)